MAPDLRSSLQNWRQFILIKRSSLFDVDYYREHYPELRDSHQNPIMHYIKTGWREGKNPSPDFDTAYYLRENKDVRVARVNPLVHYIQFGMAEGRHPNRSLSRDPFTYYAWIEQYDTLSPDDLAGIEAQTKTFENQPLISILMPVYNTPERFLRDALDSVLAQTYPNWECCIADDASTEPHVRSILEDYAQKDPRFKVSFRQTNDHISAASNTALSLASGDFIGLLDHDDVLREHTLYMVVNEINHHPQAEIIYSDEDLIDEFGVRYDPYFKPDWNPDLFYGHNLITHFGVYLTERVRQVGGFQQGYEGAQDWDLAMRIIEQVSPENIRHIPQILYHWRAVIGSTALSSSYKTYAKIAQFKTLQSHFDRMGQAVDIAFIDNEFWRVKHCVEDPKPLVSIIIPTRNQVDFLKKCLKSILNKTQYINYEIFVVNNIR